MYSDKKLVQGATFMLSIIPLRDQTASAKRLATLLR